MLLLRLRGPVTGWLLLLVRQLPVTKLAGFKVLAKLAKNLLALHPLGGSVTAATGSVAFEIIVVVVAVEAAAAIVDAVDDEPLNKLLLMSLAAAAAARVFVSNLNNWLDIDIGRLNE